LRRAAAGLRVVVTDGQGRMLRRVALTRWLSRVAPRRTSGDVGIAIVSDAAMRRLNRQFRRRDYATDVLSFPASEGSAPPGTARPDPRKYLGDIVIARGVAGRQARAAGHPAATEHRILALHGLLHLLGYDHEHDEGTMERVERRLRREGGLREQSLLERSAAAASRPRRRERIRG